MRVLHVASEVAPFAQSGGLADVLAGLPAAQAEVLGVDAAVLVPLYRGVAARLDAAGVALEPGFAVPLAVGPHRFDARIRTARIGRVRHGFVDCAPLFDRDGLYGPSGTAEFGDNHLRFAALGAAAIAGGDALAGGPLDVLHLHDWQAGAAAIYARQVPAVRKIVTTIHNLAFRGIFPKTAMDELGVPWTLYTPDRVEFYDQLSLLKAGLALADAVTTVSPSYAREILTPERGEGLDGFLRWNVHRLVGIANGIDTRAWDPASDRALPARFSATELAGKAACRAALVDEMGWPAAPADQPVIGVIARMAHQKGLDLVADIAPRLEAIGARLIVLGSGDPALERRFQDLAAAFGDRVAVHVGFDGDLARRIYAGCDLFAMPSRFEPCGLGQLYAMRYGTVPIVHAVGGLRDTVLDPGDDGLAHGRGTGVRFSPDTPAAFADAIERAVRLFRDPPAFDRLRRAAMRRDSSWFVAAQQYVQLYKSL